MPLSRGAWGRLHAGDDARAQPRSAVHRCRPVVSGLGGPHLRTSLRGRAAHRLAPPLRPGSQPPAHRPDGSRDGAGQCPRKVVRTGRAVSGPPCEFLQARHLARFARDGDGERKAFWRNDFHNTDCNTTDFHSADFHGADFHSTDFRHDRAGPRPGGRHDTVNGGHRSDAGHRRG
ncbi:pentapeptide repeat-containing protein [Phycicoccus sp. Soil803]|uniref:pentapeptide repeat-containing protein n=1 Tax=Phycicoccus sp. Soil803 TaxID=1736415 RepID=UPI0012F92CDB